MKTVGFEDHFSTHARVYARFRPQYPETLYAYLASIVPGHELAWDCGTGNGQAALGLAEHFERVIGTDASFDQIANALEHERVMYMVARAEQVALPARAVDVVTAAQALHWFDIDGFFQEVQRVLKPGGILAAWMYHLVRTEPAIDRILAAFYTDVLGPFWSPRMQLVDDRYRSLSFPFEELTPPDVAMETTWDFNDLLGFLSSWSAVPRFIEARGYHPLEEIREDLAKAWREPERERQMLWPLHFRIGRVARNPSTRSDATRCGSP